MTPAQRALIARLGEIGPFPMALVTDKALPPKQILNLATEWAGISHDELYSFSQKQYVSSKRWLVCFALHSRHLALNRTCNRGKYTIANIGRLLDLHHTTLLHGMKLLLEVLKLHAPNLHDFYMELKKNND